MALAIFAGICVAALALAARNVRQAALSATDIEATYLLEEGLERARLARDTAWYAPPAGDTVGRFTRAYAVEEIDADLVRVTATVAWSEVGSPRSRSLRTIIGRP